MQLRNDGRLEKIPHARGELIPNGLSWILATPGPRDLGREDQPGAFGRRLGCGLKSPHFDCDFRELCTHQRRRVRIDKNPEAGAFFDCEEKPVTA